jgi:hypothetical protein
MGTCEKLWRADFKLKPTRPGFGQGLKAWAEQYSRGDMAVAALA